VAARALQAELAQRVFGAAEGGKMFGVLVAEAPDGTRHVLRAFSGLLQGRWTHEGFCPPLFDPARRDAVELPGEAVVKALWTRAERFAASGLLQQARAELAAICARHEGARQELRRLHQARRADRHRRRASAELTCAEREALDQQSRGDKAEARRLDARLAAERAAVALALRRLERRGRALERLRHHVCRVLMRQIHDAYLVPGANGERRPLRALYPQQAPPSGAGDCAAPKLLAHAFARGLRPVALAEFWWGPAPAGGGRVQGAFYPACRDKCGPLLAFMLQGLEVAPARTFSPAPAPRAPLELVYADRWLVVVAKPAGLLSIPGKGPEHADCVQARLRAKFPDASGPLLVHRLDLDTSGLLLAALDKQTHAALQRQFLRRCVHKRYAALLAGEVPGEGGLIDLPLRVDPADRPRQIHDPVHGRTAVTRWERRERAGGRTRVALFPLTGRTHQLRAHAAHPLGLCAPIVGDRLYGHPGPRLLLHADQLGFTHPRTGAQVRLELPAPF
jgi:tRNA pseudouridine32 synthase/23S rRNA pseudouridine746 synthase